MGARVSDGLEAKVDAILDQVTATNGRVTALEDDMGDVTRDVHEVKDVLFGDRQRQTPGLVAQSVEVGAMLRQWAVLAKTARWLVAALSVASLSLVANLIAGG